MKQGESEEEVRAHLLACKGQLGWNSERLSESLDEFGDETSGRSKHGQLSLKQIQEHAKGCLMRIYEPIKCTI